MIRNMFFTRFNPGSHHRQVRYEPDDPSGLPWGAYVGGELVARADDFERADELVNRAGYDDGREQGKINFEAGLDGVESGYGFACARSDDCVAMMEMRDQAIEVQRVLYFTKPMIAAVSKALTLLTDLTGLDEEDEALGEPPPLRWLEGLKHYSYITKRFLVKWPWRIIGIAASMGLLGLVLGILLEKFS